MRALKAYSYVFRASCTRVCVCVHVHVCTHACVCVFVCVYMHRDSGFMHEVLSEKAGSHWELLSQPARLAPPAPVLPHSVPGSQTPPWEHNVTVPLLGHCYYCSSVYQAGTSGYRAWRRLWGHLPQLDMLQVSLPLLCEPLGTLYLLKEPQGFLRSPPVFPSWP